MTMPQSVEVVPNSLVTRLFVFCLMKQVTIRFNQDRAMIWRTCPKAHSEWRFKAFSSAETCPCTTGCMIPSSELKNHHRFKPVFMQSTMRVGHAIILKCVWLQNTGSTKSCESMMAKLCHWDFDDFPIHPMFLILITPQETHNPPINPHKPPLAPHIIFGIFKWQLWCNLNCAGAVLALHGHQTAQPKSSVVSFFLIVIGANGRIGPLLFWGTNGPSSWEPLGNHG